MYQFKSLVVVAAVYYILVLSSCTCTLMDGSGNSSPDQEGDDDGRGCVPVMGSSFNKSITTTVMYSGAQVLAFCTWGCVNYSNVCIYIMFACYFIYRLCKYLIACVGLIICCCYIT